MRALSSFFCSLLLAACSAQLPPGDFASEPTRDALTSAFEGGVAIGLDGSAGQRKFRLARATLEVSGSASITLRAPRDVVDASLSAQLPAGSYATYLRPGFVLHELFADGTERPVEAALLGKNPRVTHVPGGATESLQLAFRIDGNTVVVGARDMRSAALSSTP